ncbi:MAG: GNAT family N-acetyltransferase [Rhizomicrobium sp.]
MSVRLLAPGADLAPLAALHAACFAEAWNARALGDLLAMPGAFAIVADTGFILIRAAGGEGEILTLAVAPDGRRRGTGRALVAAAASQAQSLGAHTLFLEVGVSNAAARALYERLGFEEAGRRKGYYEARGTAPQDALVLRSNLPLSPLGKSPAAG